MNPDSEYVCLKIKGGREVRSFVGSYPDSENVCLKMKGGREVRSFIGLYLQILESVQGYQQWEGPPQTWKKFLPFWAFKLIAQILLRNAVNQVHQILPYLHQKSRVASTSYSIHTLRSTCSSETGVILTL